MALRRWLENNPRAGFITYSTFATALVALVFLTNWPTYHHIVRSGPAVLWYYMAVGALTIPLVCAEPSLVTRLIREPVFWWVATFLLVGFLWLLMSQDFIESAMGILNTRVVAFGLFCSITLLASEANKRVVAIVIVLCIAIASASTWFDVLRPYRFIPQGFDSSTFGRGAGFFINPNIAAAFIPMATLAALPFVPVRLRAWLILCAAMGIVPTFSRAGFIYILLLLLGPLALGMLGRLQSIILVVLAALTIGTIATFYDFLLNASDNVYLHNVIQRLTWFQGEEVDEAAIARMQSAGLTWQMFLDYPVTGRGTGVTRIDEFVPAGPHNMYLMFMGEHGLVGLVLYPAIVAIVALRGWSLAKIGAGVDARNIGRSCLLYAVFLAVHGFFSHNVFEEPHGMFLLAFLMAAAARARAHSLAAYTIERERFGQASPVPELTPNLRRY